MAAEESDRDGDTGAAKEPVGETDDSTEMADEEDGTKVVRGATSAIEVIIEALPTLTGAELEGAIKTANALIPTSEPEGYNLVLNDITVALGATAWADADDAKRRHALRAFASALEVSENVDKVDDLLVTDLISATV